MPHSILGPVVALVLWSMVMWLWLYATRIPAMLSAKTRLDPCLPKEQMLGGLPPHVRWKADNYNHLMEQPTLFYAVALTLAVAGAGDGLNAGLAGGYVGLRVVHSLIQATFNKVSIRFLVFALSTLCLVALTLHAAMAVFSWHH